jgi:hypothetical protein
MICMFINVTRWTALQYSGEKSIVFQFILCKLAVDKFKKILYFCPFWNCLSVAISEGTTVIKLMQIAFYKFYKIYPVAALTCLVKVQCIAFTLTVTNSMYIFRETIPLTMFSFQKLYYLQYKVFFTVCTVLGFVFDFYACKLIQNLFYYWVWFYRRSLLTSLAEKCRQVRSSQYQTTWSWQLSWSCPLSLVS